MKISNVAVQALFLLSLSSPFAVGCSELENAGFESGDFSCWTTSFFTDYYGSAVASVISSDSNFQVPFGSKMAKIGGGCQTNKITRTFTGPITGEAAWDGNESTTYNDSGLVRVIQNGTVLFQASIVQYGSFTNSQWMPFSYSSASGNPYTLEVSSTNAIDCSVTSYVYLDLQEISVSVGGPYVAAVGTATSIVGEVSGCTGCATEWSVDCSNGVVGSFGDAASLETTVSFPADAEPGICSLVLTAEGVSSSTKVIVVDPSGAFVTGGGYIISPEGAYPAQPSLIAPASFGFVSNYKKGHSIPTGDTQFEFEAAGLEFVSTSYEWLVVTGSDCAKYKGAGTVNGVSGFTFMLTACDNGEPGTSDTFRIKIWDSADDETIVYDNQIGLDDDSYVGTEIAGGNIQVHQGGKGKKLRG